MRSPEPIEQQLILDLAGELSQSRVLDAGCGDGALACAVAARGAEVTGLDADPAMLAAARSRAGSRAWPSCSRRVAWSACRSLTHRLTSWWP